MTIRRDLEGKSSFLEGRLEGISVPDLIRSICVPGWTGTLTLWQGEVSKTVYIKRGQLVFASSSLADDRLGEILLRSGSIGYAQLERAVEFLGSGKRLGSILVELGYLAPGDLVQGVLGQVKEIILSLFRWETGSYRFVEGPLPTTEVLTLNISTAKLLVEGVRRITAWPRIVCSVGTSRTVYCMTREGRALAEDLDLGTSEHAILDALAEPATVAEVCADVFVGNFEVYQYLWAFRMLGIIREIERAPEEDTSTSFAGRFEGSLLDNPVPQLLLRLCRAGETGVLHLAREGEEKTIHLKEGVVAFATSSRPDDGLTSFLLRRGIIGLREKDEIERRLLANKRAGTVLYEMGFLSREELGHFVREQVRDIVLSLFTWTRGEWRLIPGELPTMEEITLDRPVEELILQGICSVRDWGTVRGGCGDLETIVGLASAGRGLPDGVELGPEETGVMQAAGTPRTVAEICASTEISDFRTCQILWALQMIGVVERVAQKPATAGANAVMAAATSAEIVPGGSAAEASAAVGRTAPGGTARETSAVAAAVAAEESKQQADGESSVPVEVAVGEHTRKGASIDPHSGVGAPAGGLDSGEPRSMVTRSSGASDEAAEDVGAATHGSNGGASPAKNPLEAVGTGVLEEIERFNRRHREVYAVLRGAVGAGVRNFVGTCMRRLTSGARPFEGLVPDETGAFPATSLFERLGSSSPSEIRAHLETLITAEIASAEMFLDPQTLEKLSKRLETATWDPAGRS